MRNVQRCARLDTIACESKRRRLLVSYMTLATSSPFDIFSVVLPQSSIAHRFHTGPASKYLAFGGSYCYNPRLTSGQHQSMETPPLHVLLALDAQILGGEVYDNTSPTPSVTAGEDLSTSSTTGHDDDETSPSPARDGPATTRTTTSRFWGVSWYRFSKKWKAYYTDADGKQHTIGYFDDDEEAARAVNKAISDAGLEGKRKTNAVDATGALVPRERTTRLDRSAVVAPDPARAPTEATSKYWGVSWSKHNRRWVAQYTDANGKKRFIGLYETQEAAAHAFNAAIRALPPDVQLRRKTNPVVDGQLVPRERKTSKKRRREDPAAATPSPRPRLD